ncbi:hypothetical protein [Spiroplasma poulsonii]|uniref:hypothetical protein n=1 Tax=Spiroplasma poulsonii TaxID=2138 RepID=UPI001F4CF9C9|nr:hypothetical protein [Spiroplasma poulsonii]UNF62605.1 hypothetical protein MNU24_03910 [Spiroplasma poulsonii]
MKKDQRDNQLTEAEIQQKLQEIENNFKCVPWSFDGVDFVRSHLMKWQTTTQEPDEKSKK